MRVLLKNMKDILDTNLSLSQRGILITILLVKDEDPKFTLAKFKSAVKIKEAREDLVFLHKKGYIQWSEYDRALKLIEEEKVTPEVIEVLDFMNALYKRSFKATTPSYHTPIRNRLADHSVEELKKVVAYKYQDWKDDPVMKKNLNPVTIFRPKNFVRYLEEALRTGEGASFVAAEKINLKYGDVITLDVASTLLDDDIYHIKVYNTNPEGNKRGAGRDAKRYGRDIKTMELREKNKENRSGFREFLYIYANK